MSSVQKYDSIDHHKINYMKPEKVGLSYFGSMSYGSGTNPLYIQTPKLKCLTNLEDVKDKKSPFIEVEIPNGKYDLYDFFLSLDDENIKKTVKNTKEWFGKEIPLDIIDGMYKRISQPFRKGTNPKLKFQLPVMKHKIQCGIYNQQRVFKDITEIKENSEVILVIHIRGLKILKHTFHCDCYVSQIKVFQTMEEKYNVLKNYSIIDDDDYDDEIFSEEIKGAIFETQKLKEDKERRQKLMEEEKQRIESEIKQKQEELQKLLNEDN
jgi:hypothetical protein